MKFKVILLSMILALSACDNKETPGPTPEPQPTPVVIVTPDTPAPTPNPDATWRKLPTVARAQIYHFDTVSQCKSKLKEDTQLVNWELEDFIKENEESGFLGLFQNTIGKECVDYAHSKGIPVVCYTSVGWATYQYDADQYPRDAMGKVMADWPDERWGDPRKASLVAFLGKRMDKCKEFGADAVELDNMDTYANTEENGIKITQAENEAALIVLAKLAHSKGLAVVQKNSGDMSKVLNEYFDGVYVESCMRYKECDPYLKYYAGKAIVMREYNILYKCNKSPLVSCRDTSGYFKY